ncbi:hypothetical protein BST12_16340 [Mycobacterium angelicum]|uniref:Uncharacterized protein n=1 Tax=Mycobacterium angelicum TaxID=470074 RepID=A0A1W9ZQ70_MYCAN|nr:hypothetical protein BST12_16340 [Mycobacterium angelicum]
MRQGCFETREPRFQAFYGLLAAAPAWRCATGNRRKQVIQVVIDQLNCGQITYDSAVARGYTWGFDQTWGTFTVFAKSAAGLG